MTSREAVERLWPVFGIEAQYDDLVGWGPRVLDIGFGMGEATAEAAASDARRVLAVEVHPAGIAALLRRLEAARLDNVRVLEGDAVEVLELLPARSLEEIRVLFPDPWPKARHAKRRLLRPSFAALAADRLVDGGVVHLVTDSAGYVEHALAALDGWDAELVPRPADRPVTGYERRAGAAGRPCWDLIARRPVPIDADRGRPARTLPPRSR